LDFSNRNGTGSTPYQRSKNRSEFFVAKHLSSTGAGLGLLGELFGSPLPLSITPTRVLTLPSAGTFPFSLLFPCLLISALFP
jgi:hypothetical protein